MNKLLPSNTVYLSQSKIPKGGRGVFARVDIKKSEIIETCPVIKISANDIPRTNESELVTYMYYLGKNKNRQVIALGFGSIYNHTDHPNAKYIDDYKQKIIIFIAIKEIKKDEEITINYNQGGQGRQNPLWFMEAP